MGRYVNKEKNMDNKNYEQESQDNSTQLNAGGADKVKRVAELTGLVLVCFAALAGLIFTFLIEVNGTGIMGSVSAMIYRYFGDAYNGLSGEWKNNYDKIIYYMPNIAGTVVAAGAILSAVTFAVLTALEGYKKFLKKRENTKLAAFAAATYLSFALCATLFLAIHNVAEKFSDRTVGEVKFSGATLAGLILGGIALGGYYCCRFVCNLHKYKNMKKSASSVIVLVVAALTVAVIALSANPVAKGTSNWTTVYWGYFAMPKIYLNIALATMPSVDCSTIASLCIAGYISQAAITILSVIALLQFLNAACGDGNGKMLPVFTAVSLLFSMANLICAIGAASEFEKIAYESIFSHAAPIAILILNVLALAGGISYKILGSKQE